MPEKMRKPLILVKHSLPKIVENVPARAWNLSEEGQIRAQQLAARLNRYQPEVVISSIEPKARETAEIIARKHKLEFHIVENLHEHDRSKTPYLSQDDFKTAIREFFENASALVFGSETADECHTRFRQALHAVLDHHGDKTIVIVAHGTVISLFVSRITGISDLFLWHELGLPSFVVIDIQSNSLVDKQNVD